MTIGKGKYDDLCTTVREQTQAGAAFVIVLNGNKGSGFSAQFDESMVGPAGMVVVARSLREVAAEIEADIARAGL